MNYQEMSDFEINCEVARRLGMSYAFWFSKSEEDFCEEIKPNQRGPIWQTGEFLVCGYRPSNGNVFNPCNSWAYAGPIIQENRITISSLLHATEWDAMCMTSDEDVRDKNPLRAAMILFLMMKGGE